MAGGNIKVVVRVRPLNSREIQRNAKCVVQMKGNQTILVPTADAEDHMRKTGSKGSDNQKTFAFDRSYWSYDRKDANFAGQNNLFDDLGKPLLDNAFQGYNNCIFAYGQTGSGKSYSMMGYGEDPGVIPLICRSMFDRIDDYQAKDQHLRYTVEVSYMEIYNEKVRDLLNPANKGNLRVREHPATGPYVEDLAKLAVRSFDEINQLMDEGNKARTVAATNMNETSSRSHAVFTLTVTQKRHDVETKMAGEKVAKISLVDLAGSERATSTGATGARLKEGAEINRSLSTLGRVIAALADLSTGKKKGAGMVPYRDSVLTWLLKDSLGGNSMTAMIAAISPADINFEETLSTLRYADSAKRIKNHAVVNEDPNARMIRELKEELAQLRSKLSGSSSALGSPGENYDPNTPLEKQFVSITQADGTVKQVSKADIAEQLNQSEKLYQDLNQTWEEKLVKTEQIHKERESALEELGISIEKGFVGVSTPKRMPHLVNLSDDPLLAECLVYNIKPGTTMVGNVDDPSANTEIRLNGSKILREHCSFENVAGEVTILPRENAAIMINGKRIGEPTRLRSGNRIILGDFHIFRFNHPEEARAERKEQSLLRHSLNASQLSSPSPRPSHSRMPSKLEIEMDRESNRAESPPLVKLGGSDWANARREAASAILGGDQKISHMTDDELDALFEDVLKARAVRKGRPESKLFGREEDESETNSVVIRESSVVNGDNDEITLDTSLATSNSGPGPAIADEGGLAAMREDLQEQMVKQKEDYENKMRNVEASKARDLENLKAEKARMEEALQVAKQEFQTELIHQKQALQKRFQPEPKVLINQTPDLGPRVTLEGLMPLPSSERAFIKPFCHRWRTVGDVRMVEAILRHTAILKEAQVLSQVMDKHVNFQFTILGVGQDLCSSYDLVLSGISGGDEDVHLETAIRPCIAIRVIDYQQGLIYLWSVRKLEERLRKMRQIHQYLDRPDYIQHFRLDNPFRDTSVPQFSLIGEANIPLTAVFEARVQDFAVEVFSQYTFEAIGVIKLSLEPSSAQAPASMLKFNVVMHEMHGFAEHEGTDVHAQMYIPGISEEGGATTTQLIRDFDEEPIRFESVHSMSVPRASPHNTNLRVAIHARVKSMHLDRLLSWDEIRESGSHGRGKGNHGDKHSVADVATEAPSLHRVPEKEYWQNEEHDVFAKVKIMEMSERGDYLAAEIEQQNNTDPGIYQLRQGLQRRIMLNLSCASSESLKWKKINSVRVGKIQHLGLSTTVDGSLGDQQVDPGSPVALKIIQGPNITRQKVVTEDGDDEEDIIKEITIVGQWDSSLHESALLDRPTGEGHRVRIWISVEVSSCRLAGPMTFSVPQDLQIHTRSWLRPQSMFKQLWRSNRIIHYTTSIFSVVMKPASTKRVTDVWRMNSGQQYIRGEEELAHWQTRGVTLIKDYNQFQRARQRLVEVESTKVLMRRHRIKPSQKKPSLAKRLDEEADYTAREHRILQQCLDLWITTTTAASSSPSDLTSSTHSLRSLTGMVGAGETSLGDDYLDDNDDDNDSNDTYKDTPIDERLHKRKQRLLRNGQGRKITQPTAVTALVNLHVKNPVCLKAGFLLTPTTTSSGGQREAALSGSSKRNERAGGEGGTVSSSPSSQYYHTHNRATKTSITWLRHFAELRPPYLHLHSVPSGEESATINLRHARIDTEPAIARLLDVEGRKTAGSTVFAVYARGSSWIFAAKSADDKDAWVWAIDEAFS